MSDIRPSGGGPGSGPAAGSGNAGSTGGAGASCPVCGGDGSCTGASSSLPSCDGGVGTGDYGCCLDGPTLVPPEGGGEKAASDIRRGDKLLGPEGSVETVTTLFGAEEEAIEFTLANIVVVCSRSHLLLLPNRTTCPAECLEAGDSILTSEGSEAFILTAKRVGLRAVYGWTCEPAHIYQAAGLLHHNKDYPDTGWIASQ